jgi:hypothetical protein
MVHLQPPMGGSTLIKMQAGAKHKECCRRNGMDGRT